MTRLGDKNESGYHSNHDDGYAEAGRLVDDEYDDDDE